MKERKPDIVYSEPVKDIMGNPPAWILRWGTTVLCSVFVLFIVFAWLIKYPDTVLAPIEITTLNPPITLVSKISGHIQHLYVKEKEKVTAGQVVAVMETTASIDEIEALHQITDTIARPEALSLVALPAFSKLGELQQFYASFQKNLSDLVNYNVNDFYGNKIVSISEEIRGIEGYINKLVTKEKLYSDNQKLEVRKYQRDSLLYYGKVIPESEFEASHQSLIRNNIELQQVRLDHSAEAIELSEKTQLLQDYRINRVDEREKLISTLQESFLNLKANIKIWENNYLLVSRIDGTVTFTKFWSENQSVLKDEPVVNIVPLDPGKFVGRIDLKMLRSGKVDTGQIVNIKLSGYPYLEYGMVRGIVKSKSLVPTGDSYVIEVDLPRGLSTLYGDKLDFTQNMQGTAEIITRDIRLLQKIVSPFRYVVSRNKR